MHTYTSIYMHIYIQYELTCTHTHTCLCMCSLKTIMQKLGSLKLNTTENWEKLSRYLTLLGFNSLQNLLFPAPPIISLSLSQLCVFNAKS